MAEEDVDEHRVGAQLARPAQRVRGVRRHADHRQALALEELRRRSSERRVVVDDQAPERHEVSVPPPSPRRIEASRR
jgi:hypothetical protein